MNNSSKTSEANRNVANRLKVMTKELDAGCQSGKIETERVELAQQYLGKIVDRLAGDDTAYTWLYLIHENQALIHWIKGEETEAYKLIESARTVKGNDKLYSKTAKRLLKASAISESTQPLSSRHKFFLAAVWMIAWPLVIGFFAFILLIIGTNILANSNMNAPQGYHLRAMWVLFVVALILACLLFIRQKNGNSEPEARISAKVLKVYMWLGIVLSVGIMAVIPDPQVAAVDSGINVEQTTSLFRPTLGSDDTINASLSRVGATDITGVETKFVPSYNNPNLENQAGEYRAFVDTAGNWSYGVLTAKEGLTGPELDTTIAHEYLHHVWFKSIDSSTKVRLTSDLITIYGTNPAMQERVRSYSDSQTLQPTELFSFYCTESPDQQLTSYVLAECNKYINRGVLQINR